MPGTFCRSHFEMILCARAHAAGGSSARREKPTQSAVGFFSHAVQLPERTYIVRLYEREFYSVYHIAGFFLHAVILDILLQICQKKISWKGLYLRAAIVQPACSVANVFCPNGPSELLPTKGLRTFSALLSSAVRHSSFLVWRRKFALSREKNWGKGV